MKKLLMLGLAVCLVAPAAYAVSINEWVSNDVSTDDYEFVELFGIPGEDLTGLSLVLIEGEGAGSGTIDLVLSLDGYSFAVDCPYFVIGDANVGPDIEMSPGWIENGGNTILLVRDIVQAQGTDIDTNDDCVEDLPIGTVVDAVGYGYGYEAADCITYYGATPVGPDGNYDPAGGAWCCGQWEMICLAGTEPDPTGTDCTDPFMVGRATPRCCNDCLGPTAVDATTWGGVKALYR